MTNFKLLLFDSWSLGINPTYEEKNIFSQHFNVLKKGCYKLKTHEKNWV